MTEAQKKKIIDTYNIFNSRANEDDKNIYLWNQYIGFQCGYDSILDILGYFQVFDIEGKCIEIRPYNKEKEK